MLTPQYSPLILTPGPVQPPEWVLNALHKPVLHQRSEAFLAFFQELQQGLQYTFQTQYPVLVFPGSGTFGVEMAMQSVFKAGDRVVVQVNGKFSERWAEFARLRGMETVPWVAAAGEAPSASSLPEMSGEKTPAGFVLTHTETSSGALLDLEEVAFSIRQKYPDALILVDAVSTVGAIPLYMDAWGLDIVTTASQKGLLNPVGVAMVAINDRAANRMTENRGGDAFHLETYYSAIVKGIGYPFTPPTQQLYGLAAVSTWMQAETLPVIWNRVHRAAKSFRKEIQEHGFTLFTPENYQSDAVTAFAHSTGENDAIRKELAGKYALELAGGQGDWKGQMIRMGHFGENPEADVREALARIEQWKAKL